MKYWLLFILSFLVFNGYGQSFSAFEKAAEKAFLKKDYYSALHHWRSALQRKPDDLHALYQYAESARLFYAFETAAEAYEKVLKNKGATAFPDTYYFLGLVQKSLGAYNEAYVAFDTYLSQAGTLTFQQQAVLERGACEKAKKRINEPGPFTVAPIAARINTPYSEFGAWQQGDTLYYSSNRFDHKKDKYQPKRKLSKILYTVGTGRGRTVNNLNSDTLHTAHTAISLNAQRFYYTSCAYTSTGEIDCAIYYRKKSRRNRWSEQAYLLPSTINRKGSTNTQPAIGYDSTLQAEVLYFVSDRPGGKGGLDIWWSIVEKVENKFSEPLNFYGNTAEDEITPFVHNAQQRLYYSGNYPEGLGGFDIYYQAFHPDKDQGPAISLPTPLNSSYNDIYFSLQSSGEAGLFSSNRPGENYLDALSKSCCNDIYSFKKNVPPENIDPAMPPLSGTPLLPESPPTPTYEPPPPPTQLADFLPLALYFDNDEPDPRTRKTKTKKDYLSTYEPYYARLDDYVAEYEALFSEEQVPEAAAKMVQFFEDKLKFGADRLKLFSQILLTRLKAGDQVEIFVKGYTSPRAQSDYNLLLGKRRVSSLSNHFASYEEGVFQPYLKKGQLIITEKSFGETTADEAVSDDLEDVRRSVFSIDAARERRVEIVEVKRN
ncbi:MAG: hypothetical protein R2828_31490 [Saprospiraceae bacterium]